MILAVAYGCGNRKPEARFIDLHIQPLGRVSLQTEQLAEQTLSRSFNMRLTLEAPKPLPRIAWYAPRKRWLADAIVAERRPYEVLFLTTQDISRPAHGVENFGILGMANGNAIVSTSG